MTNGIKLSNEITVTEKTEPQENKKTGNESKDKVENKLISSEEVKKDKIQPIQ